LLEVVRQRFDVLDLALTPPLPTPFSGGRPILQLVDVVQEKCFEQPGLCEVSGMRWALLRSRLRSWLRGLGLG
jgi:hypothetical protein